jgi:hypothetical protein
MNAKSRFFFFVFVALAGLFFLFWQFNACAYNYWLAGQHIKDRDIYERRLYWMLALFVASMVIEVWVIWKAANSVKSLDGKTSAE